MNTRLSFVLLAAALAAPTLAHAAQPGAAVTRAQVRAELVQIEQAGYHPPADKNHYPDALQAAQARIAAQDGPRAAGADTSGIGSEASGASESGAAASAAALHALYHGH